MQQGLDFARELYGGQLPGRPLVVTLLRGRQLPELVVILPLALEAEDPAVAVRCRAAFQPVGVGAQVVSEGGVVVELSARRIVAVEPTVGDDDDVFPRPQAVCPDELFGQPVLRAEPAQDCVPRLRLPFSQHQRTVLIGDEQPAVGQLDQRECCRVEPLQ